MYICELRDVMPFVGISQLKIIGIIGRQKQRAKCWIIRVYNIE